MPEEEFRSGVALENIVYGKVRTAHVSRLRFYADADLNITAEIKDVFQHSYAQGECRMNASTHVAEDDQGDVIVLVDWEVFDAEERTWESLRKIYSSAPNFVLKELRMEFLCDRMRFRLGFCLVVKLVRLTPKQALGVL